MQMACPVRYRERAEAHCKTVLLLRVLASGAYTRDGTTFTMHVLFRINDGTQNLDKIVFNAFTRELTHDVYIVK